MGLLKEVMGEDLKTQHKRPLFFIIVSLIALLTTSSCIWNVRAGTRQFKHGTWVYKFGGQPLVEVDATGEKLSAFAKRNRLTEIYLSTGAVPLTEPRTPTLIRTLKTHGLRVEALLSSPDAERAVTEVLEYNRTHPREARFDGVHYDYEPWINTGLDRRWVPELLSVYRKARSKLQGTTLSFAADISAAKLASLPQEDQTALLEAASVLVLMAYEVPQHLVHRRSDGLLLKGIRSGTMMIATRVKDFGPDACANGAVLTDLDTRYASSPQYAGWATFSYNDHLDPALCPNDCCALPTKAPSPPVQ